MFKLVLFSSAPRRLRWQRNQPHTAGAAPSAGAPAISRAKEAAMMRSIEARRALILLTFCVAVAACNGSGYDSPTAPWPAPAAFNLSGTWSGTVTVEASPIDDFQTCTEPVTANFAQNGSAVAGPLNDEPSPRQCLPDRFTFDGVLDGRDLRGTIVEAKYLARGEVEGERGDRLTLRAMNVLFELHR